MNLDKIIQDNGFQDDDKGNINGIKCCMKQAIRQALELAAERAEVIRNDEEDTKGKKILHWNDLAGGEEADVYQVDKQSILDVIDEI